MGSGWYVLPHHQPLNVEHWRFEKSRFPWIQLREDDRRMRRGEGAEIFAVLRQILLSFPQLEKTEKVGIDPRGTTNEITLPL